LLSLPKRAKNSWGWKEYKEWLTVTVEFNIFAEENRRQEEERIRNEEEQLRKKREEEQMEEEARQREMEESLQVLLLEIFINKECRRQ
jgi:hypothetical protein